MRVFVTRASKQCKHTREWGGFCLFGWFFGDCVCVRVVFTVLNNRHWKRVNFIRILIADDHLH